MCRNLKVGSKVLVLLPTKTNKLLMSWKGPYEVVEKLSVLDYRIKMGKKVKTFHINMLSNTFRERMINRLQMFRYVLLRYWTVLRRIPKII